MGNANYTFLPYARRGLAAGLASPPDLVLAPPRRQSLPVTLRVETSGATPDRDVAVGQSPTGPPGPGLRLFGPGDVVALDPRAITRVEPSPGTSTFKPNDLPLIEFARPDLPWLFTPTGPESGSSQRSRLLPWLCLVCVRDGDDVLQPRRDGLPVLTADPAELPNPAEAWAWSHVQVAGKLAGPDDLARVYRNHPERVTSRLLCPRNLAPGTRYLAALVPLFEEGRLAGLGEPASDGDGLLSFAWAAGGSPVRLPVYHHWRFGTGFEGDFESLARLLKGRQAAELGEGVGRRPVDVQAPGFRMPQRPVVLRPPLFERLPPQLDPNVRIPGPGSIVLDPTVGTVDPPVVVDPRVIDLPSGPVLEIPGLPEIDLGIRFPFPVRLDPYVRTVPLEGALRVPGASREPQHEKLTERVEALVSQVEDDEGRPVVAPPIYGRWHAGETGLSPRPLLEVEDVFSITGRGTVVTGLVRHGALRVGDAVALRRGPDTVQKGTISSIERRRQLLGQATPGQEVGLVLQGISRDDARRGDTVEATSGAGGGWLRELNLDLRHRMAAGVGSAVVRDQQENLMASAWDQVGEILRINQLLRQAQLSRQASGALYARDLLAPARCGEELGANGRPQPAGLGLLLQLTSPVHGRVRLDGDPAGSATVRTLFEGSRLPPAALSPSFRRATRLRGPIRRRAARRVGKRLPTPVDVAGGFWQGSLTGAPSPVAPSGAITWDKLDLDLTTGGQLDALVPTDALPEPRQPDVAGALAALCTAIDPERSVCRRVHARLPEAARELLWAGDGPCSLEPILAAPDFPWPMYLELKERSQEWVFPGLEHVPRNTLALLETNPAFVESYMAGLNHEMAAELLWREFPTDQRGTSFRQFWDKRGSLGALSPDFDPDDIPRMHTWRGGLGTHLTRGGDGQLVLLIRGDLLQLLPNTLVYVTRGVWEGQKRRPARRGTSDFEERYPVFRGTLEPDVTFLGFDLTADDAYGGRLADGTPDPSSDDAGWFVVLQGPPVEPRFGLDETLDFSTVGRSGLSLTGDDSDKEPWSDIAWGDLVKDAGSAEANEGRLEALSHIPVASSDPTINSLDGVTMGGIRWGWNGAHMAYITLQLPVRIAIHADDMLP